MARKWRLDEDAIYRIILIEGFNLVYEIIFRNIYIEMKYFSLHPHLCAFSNFIADIHRTRRIISYHNNN